MDIILKLQQNLNKDTLLRALSMNKDEAQYLFDYSNKIRKEYCGNSVYIRGLVEINNICNRNCNYCGVRALNSDIQRYKMSYEEIYNLALEIYKNNINTIVMQGGENNLYSNDEFCNLIKEIKNNTNLVVTLSLGEHSYNTLKKFKEAGADRYLLRHETSNREHYKYLHPDAILDTRIECLNNLKKLGYETGCGCMIGSPKQTLENLVEDLEFIKNFKPQMCGVGPYIMHEKTPFKGKKNGDVFLTLKFLALVRIITKNTLMPATTALGTIGINGYEEGLKVGCNVIMINFTPQKYKELYEIYPNKRCVKENKDTIISEIKNIIVSCGREVFNDRGVNNFKL